MSTNSIPNTSLYQSFTEFYDNYLNNNQILIYIFYTIKDQLTKATSPQPPHASLSSLSYKFVAVNHTLLKAIAGAVLVYTWGRRFVEMLLVGLPMSNDCNNVSEVVQYSTSIFFQYIPIQYFSLKIKCGPFLIAANNLDLFMCKNWFCTLHLVSLHNTGQISW